jgi:hypothetical protein
MVRPHTALHVAGATRERSHRRQSRPNEKEHYFRELCSFRAMDGESAAELRLTTNRSNPSTDTTLL